MLAFRVIRFQIVFNFLHWILYTVQMIYSVEVKYIGCYLDDLNRMLDDQHFDNQMTLEVCKDLCHRHRYMGLQSYRFCVCGNSLGDTNVYQKKDDSECDHECAGNLSQICGGHWRNSVYEYITAILPTTTMTEGHSTGRRTPLQSTMTTADIITLGQYEDTTSGEKTHGKSPVTTIQLTKPRASDVITFKTTSEVTSVQPLECLCPCSKVVKDKWEFLRGLNLTLDQLRELLKPELDLMKKEMSVNKSDTTRMRRSKISAQDDRVSATSVGYVGVVFICLITVLIVFFDILGCFVAKFKKR